MVGLAADALGRGPGLGSISPSMRRLINGSGRIAAGLIKGSERMEESDGMKKSERMKGFGRIAAVIAGCRRRGRVVAGWMPTSRGAGRS